MRVIKILNNIGNWLIKNIRSADVNWIEVNGEKVIPFVMNDNMMEPMIRKWDRLNFKPIQNQIEEEGIYLFEFNGFYRVRNLRRTEYKSVRDAIEVSKLNPDSERKQSVVSIKDLHVLGKLTDTKF